MNLHFRLITEKDVHDFYSWRYIPPYDVYNYDEGPSEDEVTYYLDPQYHFHPKIGCESTAYSYTSDRYRNFHDRH